MSALVLAAAVAAALIAGVAYGSAAGWETLAILGGLGIATMLAAAGLARNRRRLGGLRRQVVICGTLIAGQLLVATGLFAALMLVSPMDVLFTATAVLFSCVLGAWVAHLLGARVMLDVDAVAAGLAAIGAGRRRVAIATSASDELAQLAHEVERTAARLAAAEDAHRNLLAAVSHDLRTPLTSIRVLAEAIDDEILDDATCREYGSRLAVHARAFSALIDDLFELSRLQAGDIHWTMQQVEICGLIQEAVDAMRPHAEAGAIVLRHDVPAAATAARGNPERIQRVLFNLIVNAIRHTPADGSVTVRAEPVGDAVEIEVADTGEGIDPADGDDVFEPFVQGSAHASRPSGHAGLGLAIARAIVEAHGGRIWLADATRGTRVRFSLPGAARGGAGQ